MRRVDRWLLHRYAAVLRHHPSPVVVDLGYGAHPVTTLEWARRLRTINPRVTVVGIEIDAERVAAAQHLAGDGVVFVQGGFELAYLEDRAGIDRSDPGQPVVIRAANVLRQYPVSDVAGAWDILRARLAPGGVLLDVTCDEIGRRCCWVEVGAHGPRTLSFSAALPHLRTPSELAARLPKALIHRNVPSEPIHAFLQAWDRAWQEHAAAQVFGRRQRFIASAHTLRSWGWPLVGGVRRWRLGELSIAWSAVAPGG